MDLAGRVALVTGAGRRLGQAIAVALARAGCDVAVHYHRSAGGAAETAREIGAAGRRSALLPGDLADAAVARGLAQRAADALGGRLDVVVGSAAMMVREPVEAVTPESWDAVVALNLRGAFFVAQGAISLLRRARGKIVFIADVAAFEPWPHHLPYGVSKAGVVMLTQVLARALAPDITVNAVAPGPVLLPDDWDEAARVRLERTTPLGRVGRPQDVVAAVRFLVEGTDYVTGSTVVVDGGRLVR
jgi:pteridine reductase